MKRLVNQRNKKIQQEEDMIELDPEIAEIYLRSQAVSGKCRWTVDVFQIRFVLLTFLFYVFVVTKGSSNQLMKVGAKRRRAKAEIDR